MFGLIGDANLYMVDSFIKQGRARYVAAANEAGAVLMAIGYAHVSGRVGVATVTHGPAVTNTLTALIEACKASLPIVLLAGDTAVADRFHIQNVDQREFFLATGAGFVQLRAPETVAEDVATAFRRALVERRPVVLNMPADFQWMETDYVARRHYAPDRSAHIVDGPEMDNAVGIIAAARRPVVLCGRGACEPAARAHIRALADRIGAPLASTLKAKGAFDDHPFNLGIFGTFSTPVALDAIMKSDCVIAFGASLNQYTTAQGSLLKGKRLIHVSAEPADLGRHVAPDAGLVGEPGRTAQRMVELLDEAEIAASGHRTEELREAIAGFSFGPLAVPKPRPSTVDIRQALRALDAAVAPERTLVTDAGRFLIEAWPLMTVRDPRSFVYTVNFGSIGFGVAEAVGAALASDGRPTLLITGDGGFMLGGLTEFNSAVRAKVDLVVVVCNDGSYGAEHIQFRSKQMDPEISLFDWPDFAPVAEALGGTGVTVRSEEDLARAVEAIKGGARPLLIDLKLDPDSMPSIGH
ncbi:acetolactate synthase [Chelatococcus reniformis]|uniref:Acetolactate synthase n=2 Tax=Chelatococcus reniformis TaxID=1494448 RepID=A0A916X833_9HYPH|nr:acetolactate synthase [Chelatococcus reniformis]